MKVEFLNELDLRYLGNGSWQLQRPFVVIVDGEQIGVPSGTVTDLDSIPRLPLAYWLVKGRAIKSAVLHDHLYALQKPRKWADEVMLEAMKVELHAPNLSAPRRWANAVIRNLIYAGVRVGGWHAYGKKNGG